MNKFVKSIRESVIYPLFFLLIMWFVFLWCYLFHVDMRNYALIPRTADGLWGILLSPLLHANLQHLASNSLPLLILSSTIIYFYRQVAAQTILLIYMLTNILVWLFAREVSHIGASGLVYGFFGFILGMSFFQRNVKSIVLALLVISVYGGMVWGVLPGQEGVSWESHLSGFLTGLVVAYWFRFAIEPDDEHTTGNAPLFFNRSRTVRTEHNRPFFLPRDAFAGLRPKYTPPPTEPEMTFDWDAFFDERGIKRPPSHE